MAINTLSYITKYLKIRTKEKGLQPFVPNKPQMKLYNVIKKQSLEGKPIRVIVLKARQMGFSTMTGAIAFKLTATEPFIQTAIMTHKESSTTELFEMYKRYLNYLPEELKPEIMASNAKELIFNTKDGRGLDSKIKCMTATDEGAGRGGTTQYVHMSEFAFWNNAMEVYTSVMQCVPSTPNSMVIIESTANGYNMFKQLWDDAVAGNNDFYPLFVAWFEMDEYRKPYTGFELDQEEIELKKRFNLDNEQLAWRRWCWKNNCACDWDKFHQEYPSTPEEAFLFSGNSYFNMECLKKAKERNIKPLRYGHFEYKQTESKKPYDIRFVQSPYKDILSIYEEANKTTPYVIGGDTAGEGSDSFIGQVGDNLTGKQVAKLKFEGSDELYYAQQMYCLGKMYNYGLMAIETNFSTYPQKKLEEWEYPKFYVREKYDEFTGKLKNAYGFRTDTLSRPNILANLQSIVKDNWNKIVDYETLCEMETFVKNEKGKPEAMNGCHDDHVMALAIMYHARSQQDLEPYKEEKEEEEEILPKWFKDIERELDSEKEEEHILW